MTDSDKDEYLSRSDRIALRISVVQTILAVTGLFIGTIALYAALNEADAVRKQQQASVWPYIQFGTSNIDVKTGEPMLQAAVTNSGIGPARIEAFRIRVHGVAQSGWPDVFEALTGERAPVMTSYINGRVISANETVEMATIRGEFAEKVLAKLADDQDAIGLAACYCSVFDQCWVIDTESQKSFNKPESIKRCPDFGEDRFQG